MATPITAANAYANIARLASDVSLSSAGMPGHGGGTTSGGPSFASALKDAIGAMGRNSDMQPGSAGESSFATVLKDAIGAVNEIGHKSDAQTRAAANGKANMVDVVTAVSETEVAIDAVVAVRDRVIQAYEDIMKMPI